MNKIRIWQDPYTFGKTSLWLARIEERRGRLEQVVPLLRRAYAEGWFNGLELHIDPDFKEMWGRTDFQQFLAPRDTG